MQQKRIVVVGGSAAGPKAAARARRLDPAAEIVLLQKDPELSMASCGYPYYVENPVMRREQLISTGGGTRRDEAYFGAVKGVTAKVMTEVAAIDRAARTIAIRDLVSGRNDVMGYDRLILCTGARPRRPPIPGMDLPGVMALHALADADRLKAQARSGRVRSALILGGGLIGMETAEALVSCGLQVTVVETAPQILPFLDGELAGLVENHARAKGVRILTGTGIEAFLAEHGSLVGARLADGTELSAQIAVVAVGVVPNIVLAQAAGLEIGATGGIVVDAHMRTSDPFIYAAGDCVELTHRLTARKVLAPLGDLANLEARVAGENAVLGDVATFPGTIQTGICKLFDFAAGSTGLSERAAAREGIAVVTAISAGPDKPGFMDGKLLISKIVAEAGTGRILGYQCVGPGDVGRQIGQAAMAVAARLRIDDLAAADLPYAPPFSPAIDPFIVAAHVLQNKMQGLMPGISCREVRDGLDAGVPRFLLDVRGPDEYAEMRLGVGETLIPLGQVRKRLDELPGDKTAEIVAYCRVSMRGYEAARILAAEGWSNVRVMEGGLAAWPYPRER